jgi:hypothetical protein
MLEIEIFILFNKIKNKVILYFIGIKLEKNHQSFFIFINK